MFIVVQTVNSEVHEPTIFKKNKNAEKYFNKRVKENLHTGDKIYTNTGRYFQYSDGSYSIRIFEIPFSSYQGEKLVRS